MCAFASGPTHGREARKASSARVGTSLRARACTVTAGSSRARESASNPAHLDPDAAHVRKLGRVNHERTFPAHSPRRLAVILTVLLLPACGAPITSVPAHPAEPRPSTMEPNVTSKSDPAPDVAILARFDAQEVARWSAFDDVIMGGVSASRMSFEAEHGVFSGLVSLENEGGFASVRSTPRDWGLDGARGLALRVRGDGKTYKVNARTNDGTAGGSWQGTFTTAAGEWITVRLPFTEFVPRMRGRPLDAGPLDPAAVRTLGLLITDKQAGPFRLDVAWVGAWRP